MPQNYDQIDVRICMENIVVLGFFVSPLGIEFDEEKIRAKKD